MNNKMILNIMIVYFVLLSIVLAVQLYNMKKRGPVASPSSSGDVMTENRLANAVVFCDDSAVMLVNKKQMVIDENDCSNVPYTDNKVVYVPVSLFRRAYDATISTDVQKGTATIRLSNEALVLDATTAKLVDSTGEKALASPTLKVKNGTIFVSVELFATAFNMAVDYYDDMTIISADEDIFKADESATFLSSLHTQVSTLPSVSTQANLRDLIGVSGTFINVLSDNSSTTVSDENLNLISENTNVDADVIANSDNFIYYTTGKKLLISKTDGNNLSLTSQFEYGADFNAQKLYLYGERLVVIGTKTTENKNPYTENDVFYPHKNVCTGVYVYDISDSANVKEIRYMEIQGSYQLSKRAGDLLCVMTYCDATNLTDGEVWYTPYCKDKRGDNSSTVSPKLENVEYFPEMVSTNYTTLVTINLADTVQEPVISCWLGAGKNLALTDSSLYVMANRYGYYENSRTKMNSTYIYRFDKADGYGGIAGHGTVAGKASSVNDFSFNSRGFLRIMTSNKSSNDKQTNNIYVLNSNLETVGSVTGIASGENTSVTFTDERTFLMVPSPDNDTANLFVADVSDETQPSILGSVTLNGYNGFIYPYDNEHIIAMGKVLVPNGNEKIMKDLKISVCDITNIAEPKDIFYATTGDNGTDSNVFSDKNSFWFDSELNMFALPVNLCLVPEDKKTGEEADQTLTGDLSYSGEYFYSINRGIVNYAGRTSHINDDAYTNGFTGDAQKTIKRVLRINNNIYAVSDSGISTFTADAIDSVTKLDF